MKIVVLSFNHPELTKKTVQSVLSLTKDCVLVHNGSRPQHVSNLQSAFPEVEHLVFDQNRGFSGGANRGLKHAFKTSPWALFLTNDTQLLSLPPTPSKPTFAAPIIYFRNVNKMDSCGGVFDSLRGKLIHCKNENEFPDLCQSNRKSNLIPYIPGTAFYMHSSFFENGFENGFDESLHTYWEDVDFSAKHFLRGHHFSLDTHFKVLHSVGKTCHKDPFYASYLFQRNRLIVTRRFSTQRLKTEIHLNFTWLKSFLKHKKRRADLWKAWRDACYFKDN